MTSAYPTQMDKLNEKVRDLATELGTVPSANQVMKRFKVGRPKAAAALATLTTPVTEETRAEPSRGTQDTPDAAVPTGPDTGNARRLHAVPPISPTESDITTETTPEVAPNPVPEITTPPVDNGTSGPAIPVVDAPVPTAPEPPAEGGQRSRSRSERVQSWPLLVIALGAFVAIWGGWVELGKLTGFGEITPLPGIADGWTLNSAITLPLGVEAYAAFALRVWLSNRTRSRKARDFAKWSALGALVLGAAGQVAYHLMNAAGLTVAPWQITTAVSCLPVVVLGIGAALVHLMHNNDEVEVS